SISTYTKTCKTGSRTHHEHNRLWPVLPDRLGHLLHTIRDRLERYRVGDGAGGFSDGPDEEANTGRRRELGGVQDELERAEFSPNSSTLPKLRFRRL
ncbi:hypothetical protein RTBOTA2_000531, partial [Rhodotorula toruloides]